MAVAQIQAVWAKFNANERLVGYGALITLIAWVVGIFTGGGGFGVVAAIIVLVVYYLKYTSTTMTWPAPVPTIVLIVTAIAAILGIVFLLPAIGLLSALGYGGLYFIVAIGGLVGVLVMVYGAWREYQASSKPTV
jgi:hypothetical protein